MTIVKQRPAGQTAHRHMGLLPTKWVVISGLFYKIRKSKDFM